MEHTFKFTSKVGSVTQTRRVAQNQFRYMRVLDESDKS